MKLNDIIIEDKDSWQKHKNPRAGGMSKKAVKSYRRSHPGSKIQTAVTTKPSKLKKGSKAAKRRKSFCARMKGMKKSRTSAKTARDPNSNINKSLRRWNCESVEELQQMLENAQNWYNNILAEAKITELSPDTLQSYADKRGAQVAALKAANPDATPGSPEWNKIAVPAQQVGRAKQKIARQQQAGMEEGYYKNLDIERQEKGPLVGDYRVVAFRKGQWSVVKQHDSFKQAAAHAQNIKNKYPSMEVGVRWPDGNVNLVGVN